MNDERPQWWPAWTDYPHGSLDQKRARELSSYTVYLETRMKKLEEKLRLAKSLLYRETDEAPITILDVEP